jgi:hypothetical protein
VIRLLAHVFEFVFQFGNSLVALQTAGAPGAGRASVVKTWPFVRKYFLVLTFDPC